MTMSSRIQHDSIRVFTAGIYLLGICSILTLWAVSHLNDNGLLSRFGFSLYFSGVPTAFVWHSSWGFAGTPASNSFSWALLNCALTSSMGIWSDRMLQGLSVKKALVFFATLCALCAFNAYLSYFAAGLQFVDNFGRDWTQTQEHTFVPSIFIISIVQSLMSIFFFGIWTKVKKVRGSLSA
jgi:hypothetical protein